MGLPQGDETDRTDWEGELRALTEEGFSGEPGTYGKQGEMKRQEGPVVIH